MNTRPEEDISLEKLTTKDLLKANKEGGINNILDERLYELLKVKGMEGSANLIFVNCNDGRNVHMAALFTDNEAEDKALPIIKEIFGLGKGVALSANGHFSVPIKSFIKALDEPKEAKPEDLEVEQVRSNLFDALKVAADARAQLDNIITTFLQGQGISVGRVICDSTKPRSDGKIFIHIEEGPEEFSDNVKSKLEKLFPGVQINIPETWNHVNEDDPISITCAFDSAEQFDKAFEAK